MKHPVRLFAFMALTPLMASPALSPAVAQCLLCGTPDAAIDGRDEAKAIIPLRISINTRLDFSRAALAQIGGGSIVVTPSGGRTVTGNLEDLGGMGVAGSVEIWGTPNRHLDIELPDTVQMTSADGNRAIITTFQTDLKKNPKLNVAGYLKFNFGAELQVSARQAGTFRGRIPISVEYE